MKKIIILFVFVLGVGSAKAQDLSLKEKIKILTENNWRLIRLEDQNGKMYSLPDDLRNKTLVLNPHNKTAFFYLPNSNEEVYIYDGYKITDDKIFIGKDFVLQYKLDNLIGVKIRIWDPDYEADGVWMDIPKETDAAYLKSINYIK